MGLVEVIVSGLDSLVLVAILSGLQLIEVSLTVDLPLVSVTVILEFCQFVLSVFNLFAESVASVGLLSNIALGGKDLSISARNLLSCVRDISLQIVVGSVFLIEEESGIVDLFLEGGDGDGI